MKFLVEFEENVTTRRRVKAIVEADSDEDIKDEILEGNYEVDDCYDCYDTDKELIYINSAEPYDEDVES